MENFVSTDAGVQVRDFEHSGLCPLWVLPADSICADG
jgi:hypothetical protein